MFCSAMSETCFGQRNGCWLHVAHCERVDQPMHNAALINAQILYGIMDITHQPGGHPWPEAISEVVEPLCSSEAAS